jgi:hypothetical protein
LANLLLQFSLTAVSELIAVQGFAMLEHPLEPFRLPDAPSIWRLPMMHWLLQAPCVMKLAFRQSIHGQYSPKPTNLLCLRLPTLDQHIRVPHCEIQARPLVVLQGLDADGRFLTAGAKEYPRSMNLAIAKAVLDTIRSGRCSNSVADNAQDLQSHYVQFDPYNLETQFVMQADCMLHNR